MCETLRTCAAQAAAACCRTSSRPQRCHRRCRCTGRTGPGRTPVLSIRHQILLAGQASALGQHPLYAHMAPIACCPRSQTQVLLPIGMPHLRQSRGSAWWCIGRRTPCSRSPGSGWHMTARRRRTSRTCGGGMSNQLWLNYTAAVHRYHWCRSQTGSGIKSFIDTLRCLNQPAGCSGKRAPVLVAKAGAVRAALAGAVARVVTGPRLQDVVLDARSRYLGSEKVLQM
jgi:hypothetical protein